MNIEPIETAMIIAVSILAAIQLLYTFFIYHAPHRRIVTERKGKHKITNQQKGISVIIATSDCAQFLERNLPLILNQDYPDFEVIVVDDNSKDDTRELLKRLSEQYPHLYTTFTSDSIRYISHKKLALMLGIKASKKEWLVFTEPDCHPVSNQWLTSIARNFTDTVDVVLGYSNYERKPGLANLWYMFDTLQQQLRMLGITLRGGGYMGMGRNMAYRRELFFANKGYSRHLDLERGEDDLFINEHISARRISADVSSKSVVRCSSSNTYTWKSDKLGRLFIRNKMHGIGSYILGGDTLSRLLFNVSTIGIIILSIMQNWWLTLGITSGLWIIILCCRMYVYHRVAIDLHERHLNVSLPFFDFLYPCQELYFRLYLLFSSKQTFMRRKV